MTIVKSWCGRCAKMVVPVTQFALPVLSEDNWIVVNCLGRFCPVCGDELGYRNASLPTAYSTIGGVTA